MLDNIEWNHAGHNNWCSIGVTATQIHFKINNPAKKVFTNFVEACDYNTDCLVNDYQLKEFYIALSGGLDSEVVANSFLRNKIKFVPIIIKLAGINDIESWYAEYWCYKNNCKPLIINLSIDDIEKKFIPYLGKIKHTHQIAVVTYLWLSDYVQSINGCLVTGLGDINWDYDSKIFYNNACDWSNELYLHNNHPGGWFSYTPEFAATYVKQFDIFIDEQYNKLKFYNISPRPKIPYVDKFWLQSDKLYKAWSLWIKTKTESQRYEFGSKEETLFKLTGKYD